MPIRNLDAQIAAYAEKIKDPLWVYYNTYQLIDGARHYMLPLPGIQGLNGTGSTSGQVAPAATAPQFQFTFDTIGQVIFRSIGHARLPLKLIWAEGITESGDVAISNMQTMAFAICEPIDPLEEGEIFAIWDGGNAVFNSDSVVSPTGWTPDDIALLNASIAGVVIFPGDEAQLPAALIVADKGADKTNAFRGLRYLIFPDYPINGGGRGGGSGAPQLSLGWRRTNDGGEPAEDSFGAAEFLAGAT